MKKNKQHAELSQPNSSTKYRKSKYASTISAISVTAILAILLAIITVPAIAANETIYDNDYVSPWVNGSYNVAVNSNASAPNGDGNVLQVDYSGGYGALNLIDNGGNNNASDFTKLEFDIYSPDAAANQQVQVFLNGGSASAKIKIDIPNTTDWHHIEFAIPSELSGLSTFNQIQFQTISGSSFTVYYDNIKLSDGAGATPTPTPTTAPPPASTAATTAPAYYFDHETAYVIENAMDTTEGGMFIALDPADNQPYGEINVTVYGIDGTQGTDKNAMGQAVCARYFVQEYQRITTSGEGVMGINQALSDMGSSTVLTDSSQLLTDYATLCGDFIVDKMVIPVDDSTTGGLETCSSGGFCESDADQGDTGTPDLYYYWTSTGRDGSDRLIDDSQVDPLLAAARPESSVAWSLAELALAFKEANGGVCDADCEKYRDAAIDYWNWRYSDAVVTPIFNSTNTQTGVARDLFYAPLGFLLTEVTGELSYRDGGTPACLTTNNVDGAPCGATPFLNTYLGTGQAADLPYPAPHALNDGAYIAGFARAIVFAHDAANNPSDLTDRDQWWDFGWFTVINDSDLSVMGPNELLATRTNADESAPFSHFNGREVLAGSQRAAMFYATFGANPNANWPTYNATKQSQSNFANAGLEHWEYMIDEMWDDTQGQRSWYESTSKGFKPCFSAGTEMPFADYLPPSINDLSHTTVSGPAQTDESITFDVDVTEQNWDYMSWEFAASGVNAVEVFYTCDASVAASGDSTLFETMTLAGDGAIYSGTLDGASVDVICEDTDSLYYYTRITDNYGNQSSFSQPGNTGSAINPEQKANASDWWYSSSVSMTDSAADLQVVPFGSVAATVQIGDLVWLDDGDGVWESGESGIEGVAVTLYAADGTTVASTLTDASGLYSFEQADGVLADTNYIIGINPNDVVLDGYALVTAEAGSPNDDTVDSDGVSGTGLFAGLVVIDMTAPNAGLADMSHDFGFALDNVSNIYDWGDLPDSKTSALTDHYATDSEDSFGEGIGASHQLVADMYLGSCVDAELTGQPSLEGTADIDDTSGVSGDAYGTCAVTGDDEDGITFKTPLVAGQQACIDITVSSVAANGVVNGWIDFNGDGDLNGTDEQIFTDLDVDGVLGAGTYEHCFTVPAEANITHGDDLYSRFRLNDDGLVPDNSSALTPAGPADTGEVEDYVLQPYCVGNYLWLDSGTTANVQDSGDTAAPAGTTVNLLWAGNDGDLTTASDNATYVTTTDANGKYHFCGLLPDLDGDATADDYQIVVPTAPIGGGSAVIADEGGDDSADSDGVASGSDEAVSPAFDVPTGNEEADDQTNDSSDSGAGNSGIIDAQDDLSFDFGFVVSVYDWGDLPDGDAGVSADNYATNGTDGAGEGVGASHQLVADMYLGACVDAETDGQPSSAGLAGQDDANGIADDANGTCATEGDDEDGIIFITPLIAGQQACVDITVSSAAANGVVNGWIDFNSNGDFSDAGEQVFTSLDVDASAGAGTYEHCFTVPSSAAHGDVLYSRFRLSDDGLTADDSAALGPNGTADTGEVEDYALALGCAGNYVWFDLGTTENAQDSLDAPYPNMPVVLTWGGADGLISTTADNQTFSTLTNSAGEYHFCGLLEDPTGDGADEYQISIDMASIFPLIALMQDDGGDDAVDNDADASGATPIFTMALANSVADTASNDVDPAGYASDATDLSLDIGMTTDRVELGDLPENIAGEPDYSTEYGIAAAHILFPDDDNNNIPEPVAGVHPVWAGSIVDSELKGQPTASTTGDDDNGDGDDEDGLVIPTFPTGTYWSHNESNDFTVTAASTAPNEAVEYGLWLDWTKDGDFVDQYEFYTGTITTGATPNSDGVYQGQATVSVTMPGVYNLGLDKVYIRLRIFPSGLGLAPLSVDAITAVTVDGHQGMVMNGEVEDYGAIFPAAPTAVSLLGGSTAAGNLSKTLIVLAIMLTVLFATGAGVFLNSRKQ